MAEHNNIRVDHLILAVEAMQLTLRDLLERCSKAGDSGGVSAVERLVRDKERQRSSKDD